MHPNVNVNLSRPSHRRLGPFLFTSRVWFLSQKNLLHVQGLLDGACDFSFLSEKTNKSNRLQMSLQTQNFLSSSLRPWVWFLSQKNLLHVQGLLDGACDFSFLSEKTNKSNRLQMSLRTQNFLPSSLRPWVLVRAGVWNRDLPLSRLSLFCWANQATVDRGRGFLQLSRWKSPINRIKILTVLKQKWFRREEVFFFHTVI